MVRMDGENRLNWGQNMVRLMGFDSQILAFGKILTR